MSYTYLKKFHKVTSIDAATAIFNCCTENEEILFAYIESNLSHESEEDKEFIHSNQVVVSDEWIFPGENMGYVNKIIWYKTKSTTDIERAMLIDNFFRCIILPKDAELSQFNYLFYMIEDEDSPVLIVVDQKSDFKKVVLPKIKHYLRASNIEQ
ncbi:hypothetical protein [Paenibacillus xylanilyticus]|uniref:hypothetical protein n=1 Tax=Paenibacillus xylanilyticus TaxID=248903 RepID=UPI0039A0990A